MRSARRNQSFPPFLTINMPTVSLNLYVFLAINKFLTINNLFKYFKKRYDGSIIKNLNKILTVKARLRITESKILFLQKCIQNHACLSQFTFSIKNAKLCPNLKTEKILLENSINFFSKKCSASTMPIKDLMASECYDPFYVWQDSFLSSHVHYS